MQEEKSFEEAYKRLKEIHTTLHTQDMIDVNEILALQKEAKELYQYLLSCLSHLDISPNDDERN